MLSKDMRLGKKICVLLFSISSLFIFTGCSSESKKVEKVCSLVKQGSDGLESEDPSYTEYYEQAAEILSELAANDSKYSGPYKAALIWASGDNVGISELKILITLQKLCSPDEEEKG